MDIHRVITGFSLLFLVLFLLYVERLDIIFILVNGAVVYDACHLYINGIHEVIVLFICVTMFNFNVILLARYLRHPFDVVKIVTISQLSDTYQYYTGHRFGYHKIGWVSKNKSYEGYFGGYLLTAMTLIWVYSLYDITNVYLLGITGGLISSCLKRFLNIKDYSDLLGTHGGWIDRIDSIILPILFC